jgi:cytochrome c-type biogenesis protein CcmF
MVVKNVKAKDSLPEELFGKDGSLVEAYLEVHAKTGSIYNAVPRLAKVKGEQMALPDTVVAENMVLQLQKVNPDQSIELGVKESNSNMNYVTLKAYKFPFIRLLWYGVLITAIGILMSMVQRIRQNRGSRNSPAAKI